MSDKAKPEMFNNNLDEDEDQTEIHSPKTETTETIGFQTNKDRKDEQNVTHPPNTELTESVGVQTMKNGKEEQDETQPPKNEMDETIGPKKKKDGKDEQNTTHPPNIKTTERTEFETMKDGKDEHTTNHPPNIEKTETSGFETLKDRKEDKNEIHHPDIDMTETIGFETVEDGEEEQNATHPPNILRTETVEFQTMKDGIQCSMLDIESSNTVNKIPQHDCEKLQRTQAKLKNKNKKLRRSVNDMDRTLSQEKNLVSHLQEREKNLVSEIENANAMNKQLRGNCEMLQSTNNKIVKENKMLQKSVQDKDQSLSREMKTVSDLQKSLFTALQVSNGGKNRRTEPLLLANRWGLLVCCLSIEKGRMRSSREDEERATYTTNTGMTENAGFETVKDKGIEELGADNMILKTLLGDLHKSIKEAKGNPIEKSCTITPDTPFYVQHQQIQEIYSNFKEMERNIKRLEDENKCFQSHLSCLHKYVTTSTEVIYTSFELPSGIPPDSPVTSSCKDAQDIWKKFVTMKGDIKRFEDENKCLERLLSCLHKHIATGTEASSTSFVLPSEIPPDSAVACSYKVAGDIWNKFMKMKGSKDKLKNTNKKLSMNAEDMERSLSRGKKTVFAQRKRITSLESDLESKRTVNKQLQSAYENLQKTNDKIMSREKETVSHLRNREQSLLFELESRDTVNKQLHEDCQTLQRRIDELSGEKEQFIKNFQIQKDLNRAVDEKWKLDRELLQKATDRMKMMEKQMATHQQREVQFKTAYEAEVMKTENQKKQIDGLQIKHDELLNRLSKLAGDRLAHENTNITDLSDADRPIKLAENYCELYDNEWTDAFEELISRNLTDKAAVGKLLDMLLVSFNKCREITWERYQLLKSIVSTIDIHVLACVRGFLEAHSPDIGSSNRTKESEIIYDRTEEVCLTPQSKAEHLTCTTTMTLDQENEIKRIWHTTTTALQDEAVKHLHSVLLTKFDIPIDDFPKTSKYLAICIDLCWKMGVQERPMHLDAVAETDNGSEKIMDLNKFRPYTKSGKMVSFVVWPALFLHEGGAMLVKGIAQGCKDTD